MQWSYLGPEQEMNSIRCDQGKSRKKEKRKVENNKNWQNSLLPKQAKVPSRLGAQVVARSEYREIHCLGWYRDSFPSLPRLA